MEKSINRFSWQRVGRLIRMEYLLTKRMLSLMLLFTLVFASGVSIFHHQNGILGLVISNVFMFTLMGFFVWLHIKMWKTEGITYTSLPASTGEKWVALLLIGVLYFVMILGIWWLVYQVKGLCYPLDGLRGHREQASYIFPIGERFNHRSSANKVCVELIVFSILYYAFIRFNIACGMLFFLLFSAISIVVALFVGEYWGFWGSEDYMWWYVFLGIISVGFLVASYYALKRHQQK